MSQNAIFPKVRFYKVASAFSSLFSIFTVIISIVQINIVSNFLTNFDFLSSYSWKLISICFSSGAYILFIYKFDPPKKFAEDLISVNEFEKIGKEKLKKSRIWVIISYSSFNILANLIIELFEQYNFYIFLMTIIILIIGVISLSKFKETIQGSEDLKLLSVVNSSYYRAVK